MTQINTKDKNTEPDRGDNSRWAITNSQRETLDYLQSLTRELALLAKSDRAYYIGYLLDIAYIEISDVLRGEQSISAGFVEGKFRSHRCNVPMPAKRGQR